MTTQKEFFQTHAVDGVLTDAQMAEMLQLPVEGDSATTHVVRDAGQPEPASASAAPQPTPEPTTAPAPAGDGSSKVDGQGDGEPKPGGAQPTDAQLNADNAVILARDGKHTIGYDKLEEARERARAEAEARATAEARTREVLAELEALKAASTPAAPAAPAPGGTPAPAAKTAVDAASLLDGVDFGDYSDEAIARATAQMVAKGQALLLEQINALKASTGSPAAAPAPVDPVAAHYAAIRAAHPDADSVAESRELNAWFDSQPKVVAKALRATLESGSTEEVIELFDTFKQATGKTGAAPAPSAAPAAPGKDAAAAAQAVIDATKAKAPVSLSEIPAGTQPHHDPAAAMLDKSSVQLMQQFEGKSPEEIMQTLSKVI